jgi:hypothetical protein
MATTTNLVLTQPVYNSTSPTWDQPLNNNATILDYAYGATTTVSVPTGVSATTVITAPSATPTSNTTQAMRILLQNALSANQTIAFPVGVAGRWIISNGCTGVQTVTLKVLGGAQTVNAPQGYSIGVFSTGTELYPDNDGILQNASTTNLTVASLTSTSSVSDGIGNVRTITANNKTSSYALDVTDNGKFVSITTGGITVNSGIFSAGQNIVIFNNSASAQTITQGTSVTMYWAGIGTTGNRTLAGYGLATILCVASNTFVISGSGLS